MTEITEEELFAELDRMKAAPERGLTDIQFRCIDRARTGERPIQWNNLTKWINEKFGTKYGRSSLWNKYNYEKMRRSILP